MRKPAAEDRFVEHLVRGFVRDPRQLNLPHESDAELVRIPGAETVLAVTVDQIVEEVRTGLYDDPYLLGWMTVTASASDLAAVGADPLGILVGQVFPHNVQPAFLDRLQQGIGEASVAARLPVLGGDTAFDSAPSMSATAFGIIRDGRPLTRRGAAAGHRLFGTGPLGLGSVFAWAKRKGQPTPEFQPQARLQAGALARRHASAAVDTSDGFLAACDLLLPADGLDLVVQADSADYLHLEAVGLARELSVPGWLLLAGPHGEFELLVAVPEGKVAPFVTEAKALGIPLLEIGVFHTGSGMVQIPGDGVAVDPARVRDLHPDAAADPRGFLRSLSACARTLSRSQRNVARHAYS